MFQVLVAFVLCVRIVILLNFKLCVVRNLVTHRSALKRATNAERVFTTSRSAQGLMPNPVSGTLSGMRLSRLTGSSPSGNSSNSSVSSPAVTQAGDGASGVTMSSSGGHVSGASGGGGGSLDQVRSWMSKFFWWFADKADTLVLRVHVCLTSF